jgi:hypothetical protein
MRNPDNYPGFVTVVAASAVEEGVTLSRMQEEIEKENERILRKAVGKGRYVSLHVSIDDPYLPLHFSNQDVVRLSIPHTTTTIIITLLTCLQNNTHSIPHKKYD